MILIVSMDQPQNYDTAGGDWTNKRRFEKLTGHPCVVMNYPEASVDFVEKYPVKAIFITGFGYGWENVPVKKLYNVSDLVHTTDIPTLGACGGHQLLGFLFNRDIRKIKRLRGQPMRRLEPGEPDTDPSYHPGYYKEAGMHEVRIVQRDPIFAGLRERIRVPQAHYCEIKRLPRNFVLLASSPNCRIQAMRHTTRPIYGTQFHPEEWTDAYPDGKKLLTNFFRLAGLLDK